MALLSKIFGTHSSRELKKIVSVVDYVESLAPQYKAMSDGDLQQMTPKLKARLAAGETSEDILPDAFATVIEASERVLGMRHYRVQIIGGIVLFQGRIAEMKTGEGKTLVATLPAYLGALSGEGVHIVTVNDYLAKFQGEWMGRLYRFLGMKVGLILHGLTPAQRRDAYAADITYGTNNEMGFDYLRDNMALYKEEMVQRGHAFAIIDEVDSILIDEARTPLIISGQGDKSTDLYQKADQFAAKLTVVKVKELKSKEEHDDIQGDYIVDEKARTATLTPAGVQKAEKFFGVENITDSENATLYHHINQALHARGVKKRDIDYVVRDGQVVIVDEFTGRLMVGRRYSDGLHQAIEAKEKVKVERESKTLATITFQNYFRMFKKLSGMTGTALTEEEEFSSIYKLDVIEIPTHRPVIRQDLTDAVYRTEAGKLRAVVKQVQECAERGQPVLVGTVSIEKSEELGQMLSRLGIKHVVLNAKHHEKEAEIVAQAGKLGAVTIATNMAGRGTDIILGGNSEFLARADLRTRGMPEEIILEATGYGDTDNQEIIDARQAYREALAKHKTVISAEAEKVRAAGGLFIIGTERHESRRIDNQLRGRAGRLGDPGGSRFFISMEDDLLRLFSSDRVLGIMDAVGFEEDTPIDHKILTGAIETAQKRIESRNFQARKHVLEYDDVMNKQREIVYRQRRMVLDGENLGDRIQDMLTDFCHSAVHRVTKEQPYVDPEQMTEIALSMEGLLFMPGEGRMERLELEGKDPGDITELLVAKAKQKLSDKEQQYGSSTMRELERVCLLRAVDRMWMDHIDAMHELRQGIGLRAYAQTDPIAEYKREGFAMFEEMNGLIRDETVRSMLIVRIREDAPKREQQAKGITASHGGATMKKQPMRKTTAQKVGRNDPCPCGSGKKYKKCCGFEQSEG